jgi:PAS domain S-box-containing protein
MIGVWGDGRAALPMPDRDGDAGFEPVTALAARLLAVPRARVLLRGSAAWDGADPAERGLAERALEGDGVLVIADTAAEAAPSPKNVRFFAAAPLIACDGRRLGTLSVMDAQPRAELDADDARHLERLARILIDEIELRAAQGRLTAELASRRLAEARLTLANDITERALAAPNYKSALAACIERAAEHVDADIAFARALSPRSNKLQVEAGYVRPGEHELASLHKRLAAIPIEPERSAIANVIRNPRPLLVPDLSVLDRHRVPLLSEAHAHGLNSFVTIPCENAGSLVWLSFLFRRRPDDLAAIADTLTALASRVRDLLGRKHAEERIALLQSVVLHTGDAVVVSEASSVAGEPPRIVYVNPAFTRITALSAEEVRDKPPLVLTGPDTERGPLRRLAALLQRPRPRPFHLGMHLQRGDGSAFWAEIDVTPVAGGDGAIRHWIAVIRDRTEAKAAEEAQREGEVQLRRLADRQHAVLDALRREKEFSEFLIRGTAEGILVFDRDFRVTLWNPGIEAITGIAADAAAGHSAFEVLPFLAGGPGERAMRDALEGRESSFFDQRYAIAATGKHGFYEAYFSPLQSSARGVMGGIGFLREISERRRMEDELRQSQKMEAVGQLTGGIAHDFNNMLTVIAGNLELLEGKLEGEPRLLRLVTAASLAASRAEKLTQQLLTFSRRQQLRPQPVDLNQIVIGMDEMLHRTVGETIDIRTSLAADLLPALADPNQLETALLNLVLNARDAMPSGGRITLSTANVEADRAVADIAPGFYAMLAITDTGLGMSEHVLTHVFEPFFTTKEVGKGTGLGLAQVYGFINQSSGHVRIESKEGKGTVVRLYLPRAEATAGELGVETPRESAYSGSETVLVVEDDHGVRDFAASVLREKGYLVLEASNGEEALGVLDAHPEIELLFTDVVMPGRLNGADLARAARQERPALALLFTSGYTTRLLEKEWPADEVELLRKPYRSIDLAARVRAVLDRAEQRVE